MKKILVIEDDYDITFTVEMALADLYEVMIMNDAVGLIDVIRDFLPDVILLDNTIGHRRAPDIAHEIRRIEAFHNVPLVLFSAHPDIADIAWNISASAYLAKPFDLDDLYACIEGVLVINN